MDEKKKVEAPDDPVLQMKASDFLKAIEALGEKIAKGYEDPIVRNRIQERRAQFRKEIQQAEAERIAREDACNHLNEKNFSAVAWQFHYDAITGNIYKRSGVCQHCFIAVESDALDLRTQQKYHQLLAIPMMRL